MQESRQRPDVLDLLLHPFITAVQPSIKAPTTELQVPLCTQLLSIHHCPCSRSQTKSSRTMHNTGQGAGGILPDRTTSALSNGCMVVCRPMRRRPCWPSRCTSRSRSFLLASLCRRLPLKPPSDR